MDEHERVEREKRYIAAAQGGEFSRDAVNSLYEKAHIILGDNSLSRTTEVAGAKSRVSSHFSKQILDGEAFDVYISSKVKDERGRKDERIRVLLLPKGEVPENVLRDGTFVMSRGEVKSDAPAILMFDPYGTETYDDVNHNQDVNFIHSVITDIRKQAEEQKTKESGERKSKLKKTATWLIVAAAMYVPQNVVGERHTPFIAPLPVELGVDFFNQPDHKASSFDDPDTETVVVGLESSLPSLSDYDANGAPSSWFENETNDTGYYHDGDKPGLWNVDYGYEAEPYHKYDLTSVEGALQNAEISNFECSDTMTGAGCVEALQAEVDKIKSSTRQTCMKLNIEIPVDAQLFTTSDRAITYTLGQGSEGPLEVCSAIGEGYDFSKVYVYNK